MSMTEVRHSSFTQTPASELGVKSPGKDGAFYLQEAFTQYKGSLVSQAAHMILRSEKAGYSLEEVKEAVDLPRILGAVRWINNEHPTEQISPDEAIDSTPKIFNLAERMSALSRDQLKSVTSRYKKVEGEARIAEEVALKKDVYLMISEAGNGDRSVGYDEIRRKEASKKPAETDIFVARSSSSEHMVMAEGQ